MKNLFNSLFKIGEGIITFNPINNINEEIVATNTEIAEINSYLPLIITINQYKFNITKLPCRIRAGSTILYFDHLRFKEWFLKNTL